MLFSVQGNDSQVNSQRRSGFRLRRLFFVPSRARGKLPYSMAFELHAASAAV
jgi:hypothetical protein